MIARRRIPSATPLETIRPSESGPRWTIRSHIECSSSFAPSGGGVRASRLAQPVIPHILHCRLPIADCRLIHTSQQYCFCTAIHDLQFTIHDEEILFAPG